MALTIGDNFSYQGAKPLDERIKYDTLAAMKAMADSTLYDGCLAYCVATEKTYQWKSTNTVDTDTGKWREFTSGGGTEYTAGDGISILNDTISTDASVYRSADTAETTIADDDYFPFYDTSATAKRKSLWSNIKSVLKTYFDTLYSTVRSRGTPTSGGTNLSLVNTGDMYIWNAKQNALTAGTNIAISSDNVISTTSTYTTRYLTSEQVVGTWIGGEPIYQKTFTGTFSVNANQTVKIGTIPNLGTFIYGEAVGYDFGAGNREQRIINSYMGHPYASGNDFCLFSIYNVTYTVATIRYTKTTDA